MASNVASREGSRLPMEYPIYYKRDEKPSTPREWHALKALHKGMVFTFHIE